nr:PREDICTED: uncharacterized protein LOC109037842 [Bemisia tabaci]XP_018908213.1 PREDICTED: uncharacterized protein LOC109037842 [Bemisia tabaci]
MPLKCAVTGCLSKSSVGSPIKFYHFPQDSAMREKWTQFCSSESTLNYSTARICSRHFQKAFIIKRPIDVALGLKSPPNFRNITDDAVPTLNLPPQDGEEKTSQTVDQNSVALDTTEVQSASTCKTTSACSTTPRYFFSESALGKSISSRYQKISSIPIIRCKSDVAGPKIVQIAGKHLKSCEVSSIQATSEREITDSTSDTSHGLLKEGKNEDRNENSNSTSSTNSLKATSAEVDPKNSDFSSKSLSTILPAPPMEVTTTIGSNLSQDNVTESLCAPPPTKKLRLLLPKSRELVSEEIPYMSFISDNNHTITEESFASDNVSIKSSGKLKASNSSQYIILKRSKWEENDQKIRVLSTRMNELNNLATKYTSALEEMVVLNQRLVSAKGGNIESDNEIIKHLKLENAKLNREVAGLRKDKEKLANENRALRSDKEKLEERFKKHAIMLKQYFTTGQLKRMFADDPMSRSRWTPEDVEQALALKAESTAAYNYLQDRFAFLLPNLATLRRWVRAKKINMDEQIANNPTEPPSEQDKALQNLILLHDQTNEINSEEISLDENLLSNGTIEIVMEE